MDLPTRSLTALAAAAMLCAGAPAFAADPLVDAAWVKAHAGQPDTLFLDLRSEAAYEACHVPGAIHTDFGKDVWRVNRVLSAKPGDVIEGLLPDPPLPPGSRCRQRPQWRRNPRCLRAGSAAPPWQATTSSAREHHMQDDPPPSTETYLAFQVIPRVRNGNNYEVVDRAIDVVKAAAVPFAVGATETTMRGDLTHLLQVVKAAQQACLDHGAVEVITNIKIHTTTPDAHDSFCTYHRGVTPANAVFVKGDRSGA